MHAFARWAVLPLIFCLSLPANPPAEEPQPDEASLSAGAQDIDDSGDGDGAESQRSKSTANGGSGCSLRFLFLGVTLAGCLLGAFKCDLDYGNWHYQSRVNFEQRAVSEYRSVDDVMYNMRGLDANYAYNYPFSGPSLVTHHLKDNEGLRKAVAKFNPPLHDGMAAYDDFTRDNLEARKELGGWLIAGELEYWKTHQPKATLLQIRNSLARRWKDLNEKNDLPLMNPMTVYELSGPVAIGLKSDKAAEFVVTHIPQELGGAERLRKKLLTLPAFSDIAEIQTETAFFDALGKPDGSYRRVTEDPLPIVQMLQPLVEREIEARVHELNEKGQGPSLIQLMREWGSNH